MAKTVNGQPAQIRKPVKRAKPGKAKTGKAPGDEHLQCLGPDWDAELKGPKNVRMRLFVLEYLRDKNGTQAAIRAGYSVKGAYARAAELLRNRKVAAVIEAHEKALAKRLGMEAEEYARQTLALAQADAQEVVQSRRVCCRYCHSADPVLPQLKPSEYERLKKQHALACAKAEAAGKPDPALPEALEGEPDWFDARKPPNPNCLECRGDGVLEVFIADSRALTGVGRTLFRGIKQGRDGIEVKLADQDAAWVNYGRIIGAFKDQGEGSAAGEVAPEMLNKLFGDVEQLMAQRREAVRARRKGRSG